MTSIIGAAPASPPSMSSAPKEEQKATTSGPADGGKVTWVATIGAGHAPYQVFIQDGKGPGRWRDYNAQTDAVTVSQLQQQHHELHMGCDGKFAPANAGPSDEVAAAHQKLEDDFDELGKLIEQCDAATGAGRWAELGEVGGRIVALLRKGGIYEGHAKQLMQLERRDGSSSWAAGAPLRQQARARRILLNHRYNEYATALDNLRNATPAGRQRCSEAVRACRTILDSALQGAREGMRAVVAFHQAQPHAIDAQSPYAGPEKPTADHGAVSAKPKGLDGKVASTPKGRVADAVKPQSHLTREEVFARIRAKEFTARDLWHSYAAALRDGKDDEAIGFLRRARVVTQDLHAAERAADVPESEVMNFMS